MSAAVAAAAIMGGCGSEGVDQASEWSGMTVRDSVGIEIVESPSPVWGEGDGWSVEAQPSVVIRPEPEDPAPLLHDVGAVLRLSDRQIVVENRGSQELLFFDSAGSFRQAVGGRGEGPGEFDPMREVFLCDDDRLFVLESERITVFDREGRLVRTTRIPDPILERIASAAEVLGVSPDCGSLFFLRELGARWLPSGSRGAEPITWEEGSGRGAFLGAVLRADIPENRVDTLDVVRKREVFKPSRDEGFVWLAFYHEASLATDGKALYYGWGREPRVEVRGPDGSIRRIIRWGASREPVTAADWDSFNEERERYIRLDPGAAYTRIPRDEQPVQEAKPVFLNERVARHEYSALRVDDEGYLWVRRYARPSLFRNWPEHSPPRPAGRWWVFALDGRWLGEVETPANFVIRTIRDGYLHGVSRDEYDVEEVRLYRIMEP